MQHETKIKLITRRLYGGLRQVQAGHGSMHAHRWLITATPVNITPAMEARHHLAVDLFVRNQL